MSHQEENARGKDLAPFQPQVRNRDQAFKKKFPIPSENFADLYI